MSISQTRPSPDMTAVVIGIHATALIEAYPHLRPLWTRAVRGSVQALTALIHQGDTLAILPTWLADRVYLLDLRDRRIHRS